MQPAPFPFLELFHEHIPVVHEQPLAYSCVERRQTERKIDETA